MYYGNPSLSPRLLRLKLNIRPLYEQEQHAMGVQRGFAVDSDVQVMVGSAALSMDRVLRDNTPERGWLDMEFNTGEG